MVISVCLLSFLDASLSMIVVELTALKLLDHFPGLSNIFSSIFYPTWLGMESTSAEKAWYLYHVFISPGEGRTVAIFMF